MLSKVLKSRTFDVATWVICVAGWTFWAFECWSRQQTGQAALAALGAALWAYRAITSLRASEPQNS